MSRHNKQIRMLARMLDENSDPAAQAYWRIQQQHQKRRSWRMWTVLTLLFALGACAASAVILMLGY